MWELALWPWGLPHWAPLRLDTSLAIPPDALLRWSMEPADCTSLRQVEVWALRKAKTDEWLSYGIQVQASGVRGVSQDPTCSVPSFLSLRLIVCSANVGQYSYGLCAGFGGAAKTG